VKYNAIQGWIQRGAQGVRAFLSPTPSYYPFPLDMNDRDTLIEQSVTLIKQLQCSFFFVFFFLWFFYKVHPEGSPYPLKSRTACLKSLSEISAGLKSCSVYNFVLVVCVMSNLARLVATSRPFISVFLPISAHQWSHDLHYSGYLRFQVI